jgi:hypothetical protein
VAQVEKTDVRKIPANPISPSIASIFKRLGSQKWELPYLANLVTSLALILTVCLLILLYPTIGLAMQLTQTFLQLIKETFVEMRPRPAVEKIGHGVAISIYGICLSLFAVISIPFYVAAFLLDWIGVKIKVA